MVAVGRIALVGVEPGGRFCARVAILNKKKEEFLTGSVLLGKRAIGCGMS